MGVKWIKRALIESPYCIGLCRTKKDFKHELKLLKVPRNQWPRWTITDFSASSHFFHNPQTHNRFCIVCIGTSKGHGRAARHGLLVHEAVHVWQYIKKDLNEKRPSKEFEAYSIQMIAQGLIAAYK